MTRGHAALSLAFAVLFAFSVVDAKKKKSQVLSLKDDDFDETLAQNDAVMVKFFAPWCGHCKALAPEYEKVAPSLKDVGVATAEVDCTEAGDLCGKHDVKGYPTLKFFQKGKPSVEYDGERVATAILAWVKRMQQPAVTRVASLQEKDQFVDDNNVVASGVFTSESAPEFLVFSSVCEEMRQQISCVAMMGEKTAVTVYRSDDSEHEDYSGAIEPVLLKQWLEVAIVPLLAEISSANARTYVESTLPVGFMYGDVTSDEYKNVIKPALVATARTHRNAILFTVVDTNKYARMAKSVGLSGNKFPAFVIENPQKSHFVMKEGEPLTLESLSEFCGRFVAGQIQPTIRSQPVPTQKGPVTVVVGDTFKQIVFDNTKDVLVKFYAPWCGHCKSMAPEYEALARFFEKDSDKLVIAEMDSTENDSPPPIRVTGFPTLLFFPAQAKESPLTYQGARTKDALAEWIYEHSTLVTRPVPVESTPPPPPPAEPPVKADL